MSAPEKKTPPVEGTAPPSPPAPRPAARKAGVRVARIDQPYVVAPNGERVSLPPEELARAFASGGGLELEQTPEGVRVRPRPGAAAVAEDALKDARFVLDDNGGVAVETTDGRRIQLGVQGADAAPSPAPASASTPVPSASPATPASTVASDPAAAPASADPASADAAQPEVTPIRPYAVERVDQPYVLSATGERVELAPGTPLKVVAASGAHVEMVQTPDGMQVHATSPDGVPVDLSAGELVMDGDQVVLVGAHGRVPLEVHPAPAEPDKPQLQVIEGGASADAGTAASGDVRHEPPLTSLPDLPPLRVMRVTTPPRSTPATPSTPSTASASPAASTAPGAPASTAPSVGSTESASTESIGSMESASTEAIGSTPSTSTTSTASIGSTASAASPSPHSTASAPIDSAPSTPSTRSTSIDPTPSTPIAPPASTSTVDAPSAPVRATHGATLAEETKAIGSEGALGRAEAANIEIRSEEIDEILSVMPGGLLRWGISGVAGTILVLLLISWFVSYPDVVKGRITLTTPTPPVRVVTRAEGDVARVFVGDRAVVRAGDPLVLLRNPANYDDVRALTDALGRLEPALAGADASLGGATFETGWALGDIQPGYSSFLQALSGYRALVQDPFYGPKVASLRSQIDGLERLSGRLAEQQRLLEEQLTLAGRNHDRTRQLTERELAPAQDLDKSAEALLQQRYQVENGRTAMTNNEVQLASQRSALLDLEQRRADELQRARVELRNAVNGLRSAVAQWEQSFLLKAPVSGTVSQFREVNENQYVGAGEPLVAVVPSSGALIGRVRLTGQGAGKVQPGQRVIIRFESYPHREYGTVDGRVEKISALGFEPDARAAASGSGDVTYQAEISLPKGLVSSYNRRLEFRQEMRGEVDVVTEEMRLLERVFNQLRSLNAQK